MPNYPRISGASAAVNTGAVTVTFTGAGIDFRTRPLNNALLRIGGMTATLTGDAPAANQVTLTQGWGGADVAAQPWEIIPFSSQSELLATLIVLTDLMAAKVPVLCGAVPPTADIGIDGEVYLEVSDGVVKPHLKTSGVWAPVALSDAQGSTMVFPTDGAQWFVRFDRQRAAHPRQATIGSLSGDTITLTTNDSDLFFTVLMRGVSAIRIWNVSKSPPQPAWISGNPAGDQLSVVAASMISAWTSGDVIQLGDIAGEPDVPAGFTSGYAIDVSQMLAAQFGGIFRQKAMTFKSTVSGVGTPASMDASPSAANGSFSNGQSFPDGSFLTTEHMTVTSQLSPISDSNLIYVREVDVSGVGNMSVCGMACLGVWK